MLGLKQTQVLSEIFFYKSIKSGRKYFCGHDWSISGEFDWESVLDWRSRRLKPLFTDFLYHDQVATADEMEEFFENMTSRGNQVKYPHCDNVGEHQ